MTLSLQEMRDFLKYANYVFTAVFVMEGILKIFALGFKKYIKERYIFIGGFQWRDETAMLVHETVANDGSWCA